MRFLTNETASKTFNLDTIRNIAIHPVRSGEGTLEKTFVLTIDNNIPFYVGDEIDVRVRYVNLLDILSHMDDHSNMYVKPTDIVQMTEDGTFVVSDFDLWNANIDVH